MALRLLRYPQRRARWLFVDFQSYSGDDLRAQRVRCMSYGISECTDSKHIVGRDLP